MYKEPKYLSISVSESTFMYFLKPFVSVEFNKFEFQKSKTYDFEILYAYSFDNKNWSSFRIQTEIDAPNTMLPIYVCIWFRRIKQNDLETPETLFPNRNVEVVSQSKTGQELPEFKCEQVLYDGKQMESSEVRFKEYFELIDELPRWNIYDNQMIHVRRWLAQCNSLAEQYGHTVIWFKTKPIDTEPTSYHIKDYRPDYKQSGIHGTHFQLANNVIRNITDIKRLHIMIPNNEIPQDRNIYTEWDLALQDDFVIHVVREKFEQAFGINEIPEEKDFLFLPMLNKIYRVSTMQPKNGFMGVIGWYEVFLTKYEEDDSVVNHNANKLVIDKELADAVSGIPEMFDGIDALNPEVIELQNNLWDEFNEITEDTVISENNDNVKTEQKIVTESYTNKLEDTTFYVSLKENEKQREFYHKRMNIVQINVDSVPFPINMYSCSDVEPHEIGLQYDIEHKPAIKSFDFSFGFCFTGYCPNTEIFQLIYDDTSTNNRISINTKQNRLFLTVPGTNIELLFDTKLERNELYRIDVSYQIGLNTYVIKIYKLIKRTQTIIYQEIFNVEQKIDSVKFDKIQLFGGKFLINEVKLYIDGKQLLDDKCLPIMKMYKF